MFASKYNPVTGKNEWIVTNKDYDDMETDLSQEFSRSHYGDMVHDTERNGKYYYGLRWAICHWESKGVEPLVLDIGTGTGLLAMMAGRWGATNIAACEVLSPMVKIAKEVVKVNGYDKVIKIINKRSTELTVGLGKNRCG
uniref:Methyltransferase domain-containing protein n=1 Tax=Amphimedon queenslandica TaxID=400682 RepID=A0A1X7T7D2_AMPQE